MKRCTKCLMPETRPRITFDADGVCNACQWHERKRQIDWTERREYFQHLASVYGPEVIVPWSGGKDSVYVAYKMREFRLRPTLACVVPHLETDIGKWNRLNLCSEFPKLFINLDDEKYRRLAKKYFIDQGRPKHPWECAISAVILQQAVDLHIPLIVYGEDGEQEYGGAGTEDMTELRSEWKKPVSTEWLQKYYYQGHLDWPLPSERELDELYFTQWSKFEPWSPSEHANFAVAKGMRTEPVRNVGTLESRSQNSDKLQSLHCYLMFLKFGFGRATADTCIAIRDGWLSRDEAVTWVRKYDAEYPWKYHKDYLAYFDMSEEEYWGVLYSWANLDLLKPGGRNAWVLKESHALAPTGL